MINERISILCSGVALGVYVPGILLGESIKRAGKCYNVEVLEELFYEEKQEKVLVNKKAFHSNFRVALMGQKIASSIEDSLDPSRVRALFTKWHSCNQLKFIVVTGFWLNILEQYMEFIGDDKSQLDIVILHMDADISASWKTVKEQSDKYENIWIFSHNDHKVNYRISVGNDEIIPFNQRSERYVIHGGGWGMGTYKEKIDIFIKENIKIDSIVYYLEEVQENNADRKNYILDPSWVPWSVNDKGSHTFPKFGEIINGDIYYFEEKNHHGVYDLIKSSTAIVSKPGGGTLLDSFSSATPIIFLESFGEYENKNAELWKSLGYGISLDDFLKSESRLEILDELHHNLLNDRMNVEDYGRVYATKNIS